MEKKIVIPSTSGDKDCYEVAYLSVVDNVCKSATIFEEKKNFQEEWSILEGKLKKLSVEELIAKISILGIKCLKSDKFAIYKPSFCNYKIFVSSSRESSVVKTFEGYQITKSFEGNINLHFIKWMEMVQKGVCYRISNVPDAPVVTARIRCLFPVSFIVDYAKEGLTRHADTIDGNDIEVVLLYILNDVVGAAVYKDGSLSHYMKYHDTGKYLQ